MTDPISDLIIRIKNAGAVRKETITVPYSKLKHEICTVLEKEGFVGACSKKGKKVAKSLEVEILYHGKNPRIQDVKRISKPSRRIYLKSLKIRSVKNGYGIMVLSTPNGILSDKGARHAKVGGEALFEIW